MTQISNVHASFTIERSYDATPARVFAALAEPEAKARWFVGPEGWTQKERSLDFREGGRERLVGGFANGTVSAFDAIYHDIVPEQRVVYSYVMHLNGRKISVSLATVSLQATGRGTKLTFTEQAVFIDGYEDGGSRERGTAGLLDQLGASLA
jgi:uncharacterized protein YndB with AHSA1/START domain